MRGISLPNFKNHGIVTVFKTMWYKKWIDKLISGIK